LRWDLIQGYRITMDSLRVAGKLLMDKISSL
jgi:hypothetical protein